MIVVVVDDLNWEDLAAAETPAVDSMVAAGTVVENFYTMPVCSATRVGMMTGRWPRRMGVGQGESTYVADPPYPPPDLVTLPRAVSSTHSTCLVGKWHAGPWVDPATGLADPARAATEAGGWDHWLAGTPSNLRSTGQNGGEDYFLWWRVDDGVGALTTQYATEAQVEAAESWWVGTVGPKLLVLSLNVCHAPMQSPPRAWRRTSHGTTFTDRFLEMVECADLALERVAALAGPDDWVIFFADNGTPPFANGAPQDASKGTTMRRGVRVPFVVQGPGTLPGLSVPSLMSCIDVYATVIGICGHVPPISNGGEDSFLFSNWNQSRPALLTERYGPQHQDDLSVVGGGWQLRSLDGIETLYHLEVDPFQTTPIDPNGSLSPEQSAAVDALRAYRQSLPPRS